MSMNLKKPTYAPAYVVGVYPGLVERARACGYALALHGSLQRDLDIIAVPWVEEACDPITLVKALCEEFDLCPNHPMEDPEERAFGRLCWSIPLWWGAYLDLSVVSKHGKQNEVNGGFGYDT